MSRIAYEFFNMQALWKANIKCWAAENTKKDWIMQHNERQSEDQGFIWPMKILSCDKVSQSISMA